MLEIVPHLVNDCARPVALAHDFRCSTQPKTNSRVAKESRRGTAVFAGIEVEVGTVLVGSRQTILGAERVARGWAEVVAAD